MSAIKGLFRTLTNEMNVGSILYDHDVGMRVNVHTYTYKL